MRTAALGDRKLLRLFHWNDGTEFLDEAIFEEAIRRGLLPGKGVPVRRIPALYLHVQWILHETSAEPRTAEQLALRQKALVLDDWARHLGIPLPFNLHSSIGIVTNQERARRAAELTQIPKTSAR